MLVEIVLLGLLAFLLWQVFKKPSNYPPGPWGLPLIGSVPLPGPTFEDHLRSLHKEHGDIYLWKMGSQLMLFIHNYRILRDIFNRDEFSDRPSWKIYGMYEKIPMGVVSSNDDIWVNNRRFSLRQLRDLGMGKSKLVDAVQRQASYLADELSKQAGKPAPIPQALKVSITNVIWQLVGGKQFDVHDPKMKEFEDITRALLEEESMMLIPDFLPWVEKLMPSFLFKKLIHFDTLNITRERFFEFFFKEIEEHRATLTPGEPRDVIDGYLMEMEKRKGEPNSTFHEKDLCYLLLDLFFAGSETTTSTLTWMMYYMATNPHVQKKLQEEIDAVFPEKCEATLEDKPRLPYTEAVIHETMRMSALVTNGVHHVATKDTVIGGYVIPKNTVINGAIFTIHYDPRYWDRPDEFLPERWLDKDGKFVTKKEGFMPFGVGKRQCLGESLARMELLVYTTTLYKRLSFAPPPGKTLSLKHTFHNPFLHIPPIQDILISIRK